MTRVSVATWNCADGFGRKARFLPDLRAEIVCVQEVREAAFAAEAPNWRQAFFAPSQSARGMAVFSNHADRLRPFPMRYRRTDRAYIALQTDRFALLGAWVKPAENYVAPALRVLRQFFRKLDRPAIVLGDLNQNAVFDAARRTGLFSDTLRLMSRAGLRSLYHQHSGHAFGAEDPTHWLTFNPDRPFHLDYIWASDSFVLDSFHRFPEAPWLTERRSDHLPMRATLSLAAGAATTAQ